MLDYVPTFEVRYTTTGAQGLVRATHTVTIPGRTAAHDFAAARHAEGCERVYMRQSY